MIRILIHESDKDIRKLYEAIFSPYPTELTFSEDVSDTRRKADRNQYDLVLMDAEFPTLEGLDMARKLVDQNPDRPLLLVSSVPLRASDLGERYNPIRNGVLMKPFNIRILREFIERLIDPDGYRDRLYDTVHFEFAVAACVN